MLRNDSNMDKFENLRNPALTAEELVSTVESIPSWPGLRQQWLGLLEMPKLPIETLRASLVQYVIRYARGERVKRVFVPVVNKVLERARIEPVRFQTGPLIFPRQQDDELIVRIIPNLPEENETVLHLLLRGPDLFTGEGESVDANGLNGEVLIVAVRGIESFSNGLRGTWVRRWWLYYRFKDQHRWK